MIIVHFVVVVVLLFIVGFKFRFLILEFEFFFRFGFFNVAFLVVFRLGACLEHLKFLRAQIGPF